MAFSLTGYIRSMTEDTSDTDNGETVESDATLGEAAADDLGGDITDTDDPMIDEPSEGQKGGARAARDAERDVPDTPATRATEGTGEVDPDETGAGTGG